MKFISTATDLSGHTYETLTVELHEGASLQQVLETFERFLRGAGYYVEGTLDFVTDEQFWSDDRLYDIEDETTPDEPDNDQQKENPASWPFPTPNP